MNAKLVNFKLLAGEIPGPVELVIADKSDPALATIWLSLRLQCNAPYSRSVVLAQVEALGSARSAITLEIDRLSTLQKSLEK